MKRSVPWQFRILASIGLIFAASAQASALARDQTDAPAHFPAGIDPVIFQAQVQLDRAGFAPGIIDGRKGRFFVMALKGFQEARGLEQSGVLDAASRKALAGERAPTLIRMVLKAEALEASFTPDIPSRIVDQATLPFLGYRNLVEKLSERFHTSSDILIRLNPGLKAPRAGMELLLPGLLPSDRTYEPGLPARLRDVLADLNISASQPRAAKIVVSKSQSVLRVYDAQDRLIAQFPATTGSDHDPLPLGKWMIRTIAFMPTYHYNPDLFWDADSSDQKAQLSEGPNNPVGVVWIDLNKPHYGIHGTPEPTLIGRSQSHGCIRLSNWDAARLAQMLRADTPSEFVA
ncbi:murein L,D-transpeptidase [Sphingobium sp. PAMC28499]|uniref:L,D-transpeptidase family protein n=1 Tax=Sphingobium sp. PAMC28499 TaxID=2565554 RepID=UPI00109DE97B|nr:L,D-transpeptidase family protein [Sphingobium sp. PAMC28499]QCB38484.1 murein L,D-transpeptidase [Sphingobium sp. PAMC28499]